jgi:hypothetical protein
MSTARLEDPRVPVKVRLSALWASVMFCYVYGDYFELYVPGKLQDMLQSKMGEIGAVSQELLVATSCLMLVPSLMIFLSLALPAAMGRRLNIGAGVFYTVLTLATLAEGGWAFYMLLAVVEVMLTSLVVWHAWRWPRCSDAVSDRQMDPIATACGHADAR